VQKDATTLMLNYDKSTVLVCFLCGTEYPSLSTIIHIFLADSKQKIKENFHLLTKANDSPQLFAASHKQEPPQLVHLICATH
jgi:hypothetical protein